MSFSPRLSSTTISQSTDRNPSVDGKQVARARIAQTVALRFSLDETFDVGSDTGSPVIEDYADRMPFDFTGKIDKVTISLKK
jgi:hypothetical protein